MDDIKIYFMHYFTFSEAKQKWEERKNVFSKTNWL
ncbi:MAG: DUF1919 domain-containing protein [Ruminococcus sp.]